MPISYVVGDATAPVTPGPKLIIHVANNAGGWGKGFVLALSKRWPEPELAYRRWYKGPKEKFVLGMVQLVPVGPDLVVVNLLAQDGYPSPTRPVPLDYDALFICLNKVSCLAKQRGASVHAPRIGAGLARGQWDRIAEMLEKTLVDQGISVTIYDLPSPKRT